MSRPTGSAGAVGRGDPASERRGRPATLRRRFAALVYEALLLAAIVLIAGFLVAPLVSPGSGPGRTLQVPGLRSRVIEFCVLFAVAGWYYIWSWTCGRTTLPMKTWHLAIVDVDGAPPSLSIALRRYLASWIGPACAMVAYLALRPWGMGGHAAWLVGLNYFWAVVDPDRSFLHDRIAGTRLVRTG